MNNNISSEDIQAYKENTSLNKLGTPSDVAELALFLANSSYITGQVIGVDGGIN